MFRGSRLLNRGSAGVLAALFGKCLSEQKYNLLRRDQLQVINKGVPVNGFLLRNYNYFL